jgi:hypothetical protein
VAAISPSLSSQNSLLLATSHLSLRIFLFSEMQHKIAVVDGQPLYADIPVNGFGGKVDFLSDTLSKKSSRSKHRKSSKWSPRALYYSLTRLPLGQKKNGQPPPQLKIPNSDSAYFSLVKMVKLQPPGFLLEKTFRRFAIGQILEEEGRKHSMLTHPALPGKRFSLRSSDGGLEKLINREDSENQSNRTLRKRQSNGRVSSGDREEAETLSFHYGRPGSRRVLTDYQAYKIYLLRSPATARGNDSDSEDSSAGSSVRVASRYGVSPKTIRCCL